MSDLYGRLEEIQGMVRVLTSDVEHLKPFLGERSIQVQNTAAEEASRRFYVRAVFSLIEAVIEQHRRLLLDLSDRQMIALEPGVKEALSEKSYAVQQNGKVVEREQFLQLERKLRGVYRAAAESFGQHLTIRFDDHGWESFQRALDIRDRLTHPKTFDDCHVDEDALQVVEIGHDWFRCLNNEFVRVAREHRANSHW